MTRFLLLTVISASFMLEACSGGGGEDSAQTQTSPARTEATPKYDDCQADVALTGAISTTYRDGVCGVSVADGSDVMDAHFLLPGSDKPVNVQFTFPRIGKNEHLGAAPVTVVVDPYSSKTWTTTEGACTADVDVTECDEPSGVKGLRYDLTGSCTADALPGTDTSGTITIAPFSFAFPCTKVGT